MAAGVSDFPTSLDTTTNQPTASTLSGIQLDGDGTANNIHSNVHGVSDTAVVALETKVGTGATAPTATAVLVGTGSGTSAWDTTPTFGAIAATTVDATTDFTIGGTVITDGALADGTFTFNSDLLVADGKGLVVGHTKQIDDGINAVDLELQMLGSAVADSSPGFVRFTNNASAPVRLYLGKSNAATPAAFDTTPVTLADNDFIGELLWVGDDGTDLDNVAARIRVEADGTVAGNSIGGALTIATTADGGLNPVERLRIDSAGSVFIGDTANAKMTVGLTINQGANDNEAFALKSSDIGHGFTSAGYTAPETDTYFQIQKQDAAIGGATIAATAEDAAMTGVLTFYTQGGTATTTHSASGVGLVDFLTTEHNGSNARADIGADGIVYSFRGRVGGANSSLFLIDEDGDTWQSGGATIGGDTTIATGKKLTVHGNQTNAAIEAPATGGTNGMFSVFPYDADNVGIFFDATYASGFKSKDAGSSGGFYKQGGDVLKVVYDTAAVDGAITWNTAGHVDLTDGSLVWNQPVFIGDTANAEMTLGLTINQGANDDLILAFKSSDVGHGMTGLLETDTYGKFQKHSAGGGLMIVGASDSTDDTPLFLQGYSGDATPDTTDDVNSTAVIQLETYIKNGTSVTSIPDAANGFVVRAGAGTRFLIKGSGVIHVANTTLVALDDQPDALIVRAMQKDSAHSGIIESEYDNAFYDYDWLLSKGLVGAIDPDGDGSHLFAIQPRLHAHEGAIWQNYVAMRQQDDRIKELETTVAGLLPAGE